ncbi:hypothetical protein BVG19_g4632 [[Candida] boidinii]|nr:hypothetical protein BVG19_g4632 [[Candida] boidinii]OWB48959.1 hypothetical protein B5S27_g498 [[Candida] boidinii]
MSSTVTGTIPPPSAPPQSSKDSDKVKESRGANNVGANEDEGNLRYAAYANRLRTILLASHRYVAYTSDIGESFRHVVTPGFVRTCYGISWSYVTLDVAYSTWKAKMRQEGRYYSGLKPWDKKPESNLEAANAYTGLDWRVLLFKNAIFQAGASMLLPAFTIHSTVRYSSLLFKNIANPTIKSLGPVACGLAVVPLLPYLFDEPVEKLLDYVFDKGVESYKEYQKKTI